VVVVTKKGPILGTFESQNFADIPTAFKSKPIYMILFSKNQKRTAIARKNGRWEKIAIF
jgi:hypothetical protein